MLHIRLIILHALCSLFLEIRVDLSRGVSKQTNKRKPAEDLDDNWGTRPKRGIQQLKSRKNNMPYNEIINITANPIGHDVMMYEENSDFNPKLVTSHQDKLECAGQIFATRLIERSAWNVKGCHLKDNTSAFVTFKDCNRCNGNEYKADEGKNKFTGYQKLAEYVLCNGMAEELIKESKETEEMFDSLGLVYGDSEEVAAEAGISVATPTSSNAPTTHQTGPVVTETNVQLTRGTNISPCETISFLASSPTVKHNDDTRHTETEQDANLIYSAVTPTAHNTCPYEHADKSAQPTTIDIIQKRKEVKEVRKRVSEKLDHARTTYITSEDMWKRDQAINFYNTLRRWLLQLAGDIMSIRKFDPEEVNCAIAEFEGSMAELLESEDDHDEDDTQFHMKMVASWVVEVKRKFLVGS